MSDSRRYLNLLKYLCALPGFDRIVPLGGTRIRDIERSGQLSEAIFEIPAEPDLYDRFLKAVTRKSKKADSGNMVFQPVYLIYQLETAGQPSLPFLAVPGIIGSGPVAADSEFYTLRPVLEWPVLFNTQLLEHDSKVEPDIVLGQEQDCLDFKLHNLPPITDAWSVWHEYALELCHATTGCGLDELPARLQARYGCAFTLSAQLATYNEAGTQAISGILDLYEALAEQPDDLLAETPLLQVMAIHDGVPGVAASDKDNLASDIESNAGYLLGHMDEQKAVSLELLSHREMFALDNSQRMVLEKLARCDTADVLAVNGPPGSGKTAMLKAVVAHQWVQAALDGQPCPISVAVGSTNQSVTNVINAFPAVLYRAEVDPPAHLLYFKRWFSAPSSYGTYFPSADAYKKLEEKNQLEDFVLGKISAPNDLTVFAWSNGQDKAACDITQMQAHIKQYVEHAGRFFGQPGLSLEHAIERCRQSIASITRTMQDTLARARQSDNLHVLLAELVPGYPIAPEHERGQSCSTAAQLLELFDSSRDKRKAVLQQVLRERIADQALNLDEVSDAFFEQLASDAKVLLIDRLLDLTLRPQAFHMAARYWEGCYLLECSEELLVTRTAKNVEKGLRRLCMLTPCLVSTLHKLPQLFGLEGSAHSGKRFLLAKADLLIMDESGQAQQRLGLPLLSLTRKALVVGDVDQLQPVITDISVVDEVHAYHAFGYNSQEYINARVRRFTTRNGSMLALIREASRYSHQGLGLMLRGHYRCQTNIIQCCNEMVYDNKLMFMAHDGVERGPLPSFSWVHSDFANESSDKSRLSRGEASLIAGFLSDRWAEIFDFYRAKDEARNKPLRGAGELIAVVTPFKPQIEPLRQALRDASRKIAGPPGFTQQDIERITIGTVDSLQGAEKPIVIFSGVHGSKSQGQPYFQDQPYLLNVAISRAQDCFVAFICEHTYGVNADHRQVDLQELRKNSARYMGYYLGQACHAGSTAMRRCERLFPKRLVIIEAGGKQQALSEYLGSDYEVWVTDGGITEVDAACFDLHRLIASGFKLRYQLKPGAQALVEQIRQQAPLFEEIILATDDDYVGETIAWHLSMQLRHDPLVQERLTRVRLTAITREAIEEGFQMAGLKEHESRLKLLKNGRKADVAEKLAEERAAWRKQRAGIDTSRVRAELFRELVDVLVRIQCQADSPSAHVVPAELEQLLDSQLLVKGGDSLSCAALGRVRMGILDVLAESVKRRFQAMQDEHLSAHLSVAGKQFSGRIAGDSVESLAAFRGQLLKKMKSTQSNSIAGESTRWVASEPAARSTSRSAPSGSTLDILKLAQTTLDIKPLITMLLLQKLYEGSF
ncbi:DNA topoisomerase type IA [Pseudomonas cichorii]|uniref:DNA topoisomerase type IA n=1 Tax=Pseudomonas cichorii TaxID=36746 RepID=A0A3M4LS90_PSECI|nr:AAA domain-containing protein [Pseudomonas cichorii]RMQ44343.1 DNA topoisomerase type IA [Pseudomonas cichorii]